MARFKLILSKNQESIVRKTTLPNGVRIVTEVVDEVYSASIGIWIDVGSVDEEESNNGVSHCLEHMLFKGTERRSAEDISQEIEDVGGSLGAATGKENTCFYGRVIGDKLPVAVDLLLDMLTEARLSQEDLDLERQVILEEIKMYDDDPEDYAHETLIENIWKGHPLSRPITGTYESVGRFSSEMLREHVTRFYSPKNCVVSIAGKFDETEALAQLAEGLSKLSEGRPKINSGPAVVKKYRAVKHREIEQAHISIAVQGLKVIDPRRYEIAMLDLCLGGNMSSRLFQEVREKRGLVYSINSFRESHMECGLFGIYAGCSPKHVKEVLKLTSAELVRTKEVLFQAREIERAKTQLKADLLLGLESMRNRTSRNAYSELYLGRQETVAEICADIDRVTAEDVRQVARDILIDDSLSMIIVGPREGLAEQYDLRC